MSGFKPSPGDAAKALAGRLPDLEGRLIIIGLTPAGRGGWLTKRKRTVFWISRGKAYIRREHQMGGSKYPLLRYGHNGPCHICAAYSPKCDRQQLYAPEPEPGLKLTAYFGHNAEAGLFAYVIACPACAQEHVLVQKAYNDPDIHQEIWADELSPQGMRVIARTIASRPHPTLTRYHAPDFVADIRSVQRGEASLNSLEPKEQKETWTTPAS